MDELCFKVASTEEEIRLVKKIREIVFVEEQGIPSNLDFDDKDERSIHLLVMLEGKSIGAGRVTIENEVCILSRICLIKEFRGKCLGKKIVEELEMIGMKANAKIFKLSPHEHLYDFYTSLGYKDDNQDQVVGQHRLLTMSKVSK